jgi:hypothetical protein
MRLLELFCGTKSVGRVAEQLGWKVISLDIERKFAPTHLCDILEFDETMYPRDHFDMVWASPPCTQFSVAKTVGERDIAGASAIVQRTREIIQYYNPAHWVIENPVGLLREQPLMVDLAQYRKTVSYCRYGFAYRKNTDLWTNIRFLPKRCERGSYCDAKATRGKHDKTVQGSHYKDGKRTDTGTATLKERYAVPARLIEDLLSISVLETIRTAEPPHACANFALHSW